MPIFDFACWYCKTTTEYFIPVSTIDNVRRCGDCKCVLERLIAAPHVRFKGEGWESPKHMHTPDPGDNNDNKGK